MPDHSRYENYMDDDTVEVGCHYCKWFSGGHEDEDAADRAWEHHVETTAEEDHWPDEGERW